MIPKVIIPATTAYARTPVKNVLIKSIASKKLKIIKIVKNQLKITTKNEKLKIKTIKIIKNKKKVWLRRSPFSPGFKLPKAI